LIKHQVNRSSAMPHQTGQSPMLNTDMPSIDDKAGHRIPDGFFPVIDAHVHVFPDKMFSAVRHWFDEHAWHIRYQLTTSQVFDFLLSHGVDHIIALQYAHAPGLAGHLNHYLSEQCRPYAGRVTGLATVFPGEPDAEAILQQAFDSGLGGLKLHAHVQCFDIDSAQMDAVFDTCQANRKPVVIHFGKEPKSSAYACDPYVMCAADKLERVLNDFPGLNICVPHLGFSETTAYRNMIEKYDNLWLDTTMVLTDYFPMDEKIDLHRYRDDRVMYGSDFPNIPYAWDRELKWLATAKLSGDRLERLLNRNAREFFDLDESQ
jgi:predicted TIM-barrel fold metal-dependent hydrolase